MKLIEFKAELITRWYEIAPFQKYRYARMTVMEVY